MRRSDAAALIDRVRELATHETISAHELRCLLLRFRLEPLKPCSGNAHRAEVGGNQDNCMLCAPRWGLQGPKEPVT